MIGTKNTREGMGQGQEMMGGQRSVKRKERGRESRRNIWGMGGRAEERE